MFITLVAVTLTIYHLREKIIKIFTTDETVLKIAVSTIWIVSINSFPDAFKGMQRGVIRGLGVQKVTAYVNVLCHWIINLSC